MMMMIMAWCLMLMVERLGWSRVKEEERNGVEGCRGIGEIKKGI